VHAFQEAPRTLTLSARALSRTLLARRARATRCAGPKTHVGVVSAIWTTHVGGRQPKECRVPYDIFGSRVRNYEPMRSTRKRPLMIAGLALALAIPTITLLFIGIVGPKAGLTHLHRTLAAVEARVLLRTPSLLGLIAVGPTARERGVWNELLLGFSTVQHPVAVNPQSAWAEAPKDAPELFDRVVEGSPNMPGEPRAVWAVHDFLVRNSQPGAS
jgi:hypothetical protein